MQSSLFDLVAVKILFETEIRQISLNLTFIRQSVVPFAAIIFYCYSSPKYYTRSYHSVADLHHRYHVRKMHIYYPTTNRFTDRRWGLKKRKPVSYQEKTSQSRAGGSMEIWWEVSPSDLHQSISTSADPRYLSYGTSQSLYQSFVITVYTPMQTDSSIGRMVQQSMDQNQVDALVPFGKALTLIYQVPRIGLQAVYLAAILSSSIVHVLTLQQFFWGVARHLS